jgi:hypothetical protein
MSLCDFEDRLTVYAGYSNTASVIPLANAKTGERLDLTDATEVRVCIGGVEASSEDDPAYVWWDQNEDDEWVIHFQPGMFTAVPTGEQSASIIVFSGEYVAGLVLTNAFPLTIEAMC